MSTNPAPVERASTPWMATFFSCCRILSIHQGNLHDWTGKTLTHRCSMRCLCCRLVQGLEFPGIFIFLLTISQPIQTDSFLSFLSPIIWYSASAHNKNNIYRFWMITTPPCGWSLLWFTIVCIGQNSTYTGLDKRRFDSFRNHLEVLLVPFFPCCSWSETLSAILFDGWHPSQKNVRCKALGKPDWSSFGLIQWVPWNK